MGLTANDKGGDFKKVPEGVHMATCIWLYDLGTQHNAQFNVDQQKCLIAWEIPEERVDIEGASKAMVISKKYTVSLNVKASLRKDLEAWRGRAFTEEELAGFNLKNILGKPCQLQVIHKQGENGKVYANIAAIMAVPKGHKPTPPENDLILFDMDAGSCVPDNVPEWIMTMISASPEYKDKYMGTCDTSDEPPPLESDMAPF